MVPRDIIAVCDRHFIVLAVSGAKCAAVPIASGYHRQARGDVRLPRGVAGLLHPVARCSPVELPTHLVAVGRITALQHADIMASIRRVQESLAMERKYGADRSYTVEASREMSAVR